MLLIHFRCGDNHGIAIHGVSNCDAIIFLSPKVILVKMGDKLCGDKLGGGRVCGTLGM